MAGESGLPAMRGDPAVQPCQCGLGTRVPLVIHGDRVAAGGEFSEQHFIQPLRHALTRSRHSATGALQHSALSRFSTRPPGLPRRSAARTESAVRDPRTAPRGSTTTVNGAIWKLLPVIPQQRPDRGGGDIGATPTASAKITSGSKSRRRSAACTRSEKRQQKQPPVTCPARTPWTAGEFAYPPDPRPGRSGSRRRACLARSSTRDAARIRLVFPAPRNPPTSTSAGVRLKP